MAVSSHLVLYQKRWKQRACRSCQGVHRGVLHWVPWNVLRLSFQLPECSSLELRELHPGVERLDSMCTPGKAPPLGLPLLPACSPTTSALQCLCWARMPAIQQGPECTHSPRGSFRPLAHLFPRTLNTEVCKRTWKGLGNLSVSGFRAGKQRTLRCAELFREGCVMHPSKYGQWVKVQYKVFQLQNSFIPQEFLHPWLERWLRNRPVTLSRSHHDLLETVEQIQHLQDDTCNPADVQSP